MRWVALILCVACQPQVHAASPDAPPSPATTTSAARAPVVKPDKPLCLPADNAQKGAVRYAGAQDGGVAFCVSGGVALDADVCVRYEAGAWTKAERTFHRDFIAPSLPAQRDAHVSTMSAAGTMTVCASKERCATMQMRKPMKDAFDEVLGDWPAIGLSDRRVLLARTSGPLRNDMLLEIWDVDVQRAVKSKRLDGSGFDLMPLAGTRALLLLCEPHPNEGVCRASVVDTTSLATTPLDIQLAQARSGGVNEQLLHPFANGWVLVDIRGTEVIWLDAAGAVTRRVSVEPLGDEDPIIGRFADDRIAILEQAPYAGTGAVVNLTTGRVTKIAVPPC